MAGLGSGATCRLIMATVNGGGLLAGTVLAANDMHLSWVVERAAGLLRSTSVPTMSG